MANLLNVDVEKPYGTSDLGHAFDIRPGLLPSNWFFNNTYAWPVPSGPSPITLRPTPIDPLWETTVYDGTQDKEHFRRYTKDDFRILLGGLTQYPGSNATDWILLTQEANTVITGVEFLEFGDGLFIEFCASGRPGTNKKIMEIQFGNPIPSKAFWLTLYENGRGYLSTGTIDLTNPANQLADGLLVPATWGSIINKWIKLFILSYGRNKILISSSTGNSFIYENRDVAKSIPKKGQNQGFTPLSSLPGQNFDVFSLGPGLMKPGYYQISTFTKTAMKPRPTPYFPTGTATPKHLNLFSTPGYPNSSPPLTSSQIVSKDTFDIIGIGPTLPGGNVPVKTTHNPTNIHNEKWAITPTVTLRRPDATHKDVHKTPVFYRNEATIPQTNATKPRSAANLFSDIIEFTHHHSEDNLTGKIKLRNAENHAAYSIGFGIPFEYSENGNVWLKTLLISPSWEDRGQPQYQNGQFVNRPQYLSWDMTGFEKDLQEAFIQCVTRFDGMGIDNAIMLLLTSIGFPADGSQWDIDALPVDANGDKINKTSNGEVDDNATNLSDVAKSVMDWIKYFIDTYTTCDEHPFHWVAGFRPFFNVGTGKYEWRFFFKNPDLMPKGPGNSVQTFYPSADIAMHFDGSINVSNAYKNVHESMYNPTAIEPESNHLYVAGVMQTTKANSEEQTNAGDQTDAVIIKEIKDKNSMDSNLALGSRPTNWLGKDKRVVYIDGSLNTDALVAKAVGNLSKRLFVARESWEIQTEWNPTIRIWDQITTWTWLDNIPHPSVDYMTMRNNTLNYKKQEWRVIGISIEHKQDVDTNPGVLLHRKARYTLERKLP